MVSKQSLTQRFTSWSSTRSPSRLATSIRAINTRTRQQWNSWRDSKEEPKVAQHRSRKLAILQTAYHLLPILACIALIILNLRITFIGSVSTVTLTALQFAAKGLELLMQGSITILVLAAVRSQLLSSTPLPFGGAIAAYRATDVSYLWSRDFWGFVTSNWYRGWQSWAVLVFLPTAALLATLVGPSAAVLMIPRSTYGNADRILVLTEPNATFYPRTIDLVDGKFHLEAEIQPTLDQVSGGLTSIDTTCSEQGNWENERQKCSFTIADASGPRILNYFAAERTQDYLGPYGYDMASTISSRVASTALRDAYTDGLTRILQPYFAMNCWHTYSSPKLTDDSHYVYFGPGNDYLNQLIPLTRLVPNSDNNKIGESEYVTLPASDNTDCEPSVPTFVSFHNLPDHISNDTALMVAFSDGGGMESCAIAAHWIEAATNITLGVTNIDEDFRHLNSRSHETQAIKISLKWLAHAVAFFQFANNDPSTLLLFVATLAQAALPSGNSSMSYTSYEDGGVKAICMGSDTTTIKQDDAMNAYCKKQGYFQEYEEVRLYVTSENYIDPASLGQFVIQGLSAGYGYNLEASTVRLSLAVIMLYLCITTAYLLYSVITGRTASSWNSIAELVALALNSQRPDVLKNTSVGIKTLETFRQPVSVRVNGHGSLELVFGDGKEEVLSVYRDVVPNEKY